MIHYRYEQHYFSEKSKTNKIKPESHVTTSNDNKFTRFLDFQKYGYKIKNKLFSLGMDTLKFYTHCVMYGRTVKVCYSTLGWKAQSHIYFLFVSIKILAKNLLEKHAFCKWINWKQFFRVFSAESNLSNRNLIKLICLVLSYPIIIVHSRETLSIIILIHETHDCEHAHSQHFIV